MLKEFVKYDPLYRVIEVSKELLDMEKKLSKEYERLKNISNLGLVTHFFETAKFSKYEHLIGTLYQVNSLISNTKIEEKYKKPLLISAIILHLGHFPYTYATEEALLLAANCGKDINSNRAKDYIKLVLNKVLKAYGKGEEFNNKEIKAILFMKDPKKLYRFFSLEILLDSWKKIKSDFELNDESLKIIIGNLIDERSPGYKYLNLANKSDYVQRDALYLGCAKLDVSPKLLYKNLSDKYSTKYSTTSINEQKLIQITERYLTERFYENPDVISSVNLYTKILASLFLSKNFKLQWLKKFDDDAFKSVITTGIAENNERVHLPNVWTKRAENVLKGDYANNFKRLFTVDLVKIPKVDDIVKAEYYLLKKKASKRGIFRYPFDSGILLYIKYAQKETWDTFKVTFFVNDHIDLLLFLTITDRLTYSSPFFQLFNINEGLARLLSWTGEVRISNECVIEAVSEAIKLLSKKDPKFMRKYILKLMKIKEFRNLWRFRVDDYILYLLRDSEVRDNEIMEQTAKWFSRILLILPLKILRFRETVGYMEKIKNKILELIKTSPQNIKGNYFEALCLLNLITCEKNESNRFEMVVNGMVVLENQNNSKKSDKNEFDIIRIVKNKRNIEIKIYACSISGNIVKKNRDQLVRIVDYLKEKYGNRHKNVHLNTYYMMPKSVKNENYDPKIEPEIYSF